MSQICMLFKHKFTSEIRHLSIQDTSPGPQDVHNRGVPLAVHRTLHQVPKVSTIEGFHCIQDTSPGPQGVHNKGVPLVPLRQEEILPEK